MAKHFWRTITLAGYFVVSVVGVAAYAAPQQEVDSFSPEAARDWTDKTKEALLPHLDADFIAKAFGIHGGKDVDLGPNVRLRVPDGMLALAQPYADFFMERFGIEGHPESYVMAIPWRGAAEKSVEEIVLSEGISLIQIVNTGHMRVDDPDLDEDDLRERFQQAFARTASSHGNRELTLFWEVPPILRNDISVPSLTWNAKIAFQDSAGLDVIELPTVVLIARTFVVRLEHFPSPLAPSALPEQGGSTPFDRLKLISERIEIAKGQEHTAYQVGSDTVSNQELDELIAPREYKSKRSIYKTTFIYMLAAAIPAIVLVVLFAKLSDLRDRRIRETGIDAIAYLTKVTWRPVGKDDVGAWLKLDLQMPDGSTLSVKHGLTFSSQKADQFRDKVAVGKTCDVKLDPTKPRRFVVVACDGTPLPQ